MAISDISPSEISSILRNKISNFKSERELSESGTVLQYGDGIARVHGLNRVGYGELVVFEDGTQGIVLDLDEDNVGVVLLGRSQSVKEGTTVKRSNKVLSIKVGEGMLGRVVNAIGEPIDGKGAIEGDLIEVPLERKAPGVIYRSPVNQPLQTGLKAIDSMIPVGRGQRELIIGDRQTGKTTIALDTILNQREYYEKGEPVYCIYVAVGQKASSVASIVKKLEQGGAMAYTTVFVAGAADSASMQVYSCFSGASLGEYFRDTGRPALIVYDDLSKQAVAYREMSLLLRRPPGREAYPGDVFYLHSRLLERSARITDSHSVSQKMNDLPDPLKAKVTGGGSLTALPIIETQEGDVSAYIPTNVISITDGQIFLDNDMFNSGIRPAIDVGISVSRVGSSAQIKPMKIASSTIKSDQSQFSELESFLKFGSTLDEASMDIVRKGQRNVEILKQKEGAPFRVEEQIVSIYMGTRGLITDIPVSRVRDFEQSILSFLDKEHKDVMDRIKTTALDRKKNPDFVDHFEGIVKSYVKKFL